jgi:ABC-type bacteriocin/lantibiotic exporter with double-glycine peptidase domain
MGGRGTSLGAAFKQCSSFVSFVASEFGSFYPIVGLTLIVLVFEYAATSLMIPLSASAQGAGNSAVRFWRIVLDHTGQQPEPRAWLWLFFLVMIARLFFGYLQSISTTRLGKNVHRVLSDRIFGHVVSAEPLTSVYTRSVGHYITLAGDDTFRCGTIISTFLQCSVSLCTAGVALAVLFQFSTPLFYAVAMFLALCAVTIAILSGYILRLNQQSNALSRELNTVFVEALNSLRSIRALHAEWFVRTGYAQQITRYVHMLFKIDAVKAAIKSFPAILLLIIAAILMRQGSSLTLSEASLLGVTIIIIRVFASMGQFITAGTLLLTDLRAVGDIETLVSRSGQPSGAAPQPAIHAVESIALSDVDFGYGARVRILDHVSVQFEKGNTYAIVGPSGSGKSTLADIMLGLVSPDAGRVTINADRLPLSAARGRLMLVEQQPKIFSTTLRENLLFGFRATDERLWEALRLVDLEYTVKHLRNGLDTVLSYQGENFSGGQRQRIGIARGLIRDPDVLILDEATSALDIATRKIVVSNIRNHMRNGILVLITHDPHQAELADTVFDFGKFSRDQPAQPEGSARVVGARASSPTL